MLPIVNVDVALTRNGRWLLIVRGAEERHAPGTLGLVGGKVDTATPGSDILEATARREVAEEIGVDLSGVDLHYVESTLFTNDSGDPVLNVVFAGHLPADARPVIASPAEVAALVWCHEADLEAGQSCPSWTRQSIHRSADLLRQRSGVPALTRR